MQLRHWGFKISLEINRKAVVMKIEFELNGQKVSVDVEPTMRLLDVLREHFGLISVKEGCGEGECGSCSVLLDGKAVPSCLVPVGMVMGRRVMTIEGYRKTKKFKVLLDAFAEAGAVQCGFCTPGIIMAVESLLSENPHPTDEEIRRGLSGNLCRCTGYNMIVNAVKLAAQKGAGLW